MPSKSKAQYKLMQIASYNKEFAENRGIDQKVAKEWAAEDKKKRKEDPEWYETLPDKADDDDEKAKKKPKAKKAEVSTESKIKIPVAYNW